MSLESMTRRERILAFFKDVSINVLYHDRITAKMIGEALADGVVTIDDLIKPLRDGLAAELDEVVVKRDSR